MSPQWSLQDAKNKFSAVVDAAVKGIPQYVTRRGTPAVVVLAAEKYERMLRQERLNAPDFARFLLSMPSADPVDEQKDGPETERLRLREVEF
jgi:prevent-host-death family protein